MKNVFLFDCMNTVFDLQNVPSAAVAQYAGQRLVKKTAVGSPATRTAAQWRPLDLDPSFSAAKLHPDAEDGLARLRSQFEVYAFTNCPIPWVERICDGWANAIFSGIVPLEYCGWFKPAPVVYPWAAGWIGVPCENCTVVTANPSFGDIEGAKSCGMKFELIRCPGAIANIRLLADKYGC